MPEDQKPREEKKPKILFNVTWIDLAMLAAFVFLIWLMFNLNEEGNQCLSNPLVYGSQQATNDTNDIICSCFFTDGSYSPFQFNKEKITGAGVLGFSNS